MPPKKKKTIPRPVHFETTIPVIRQCRRCGVWLAAGVAEGIKAEIEIVQLDRAQAIWAILNKVELYVLRRTGLVHMDASRLQKPTGELYPQHRCDVKWPPAPKRNDVQESASSSIPPY